MSQGISQPVQWISIKPSIPGLEESTINVTGSDLISTLERLGWKYLDFGLWMSPATKKATTYQNLVFELIHNQNVTIRSFDYDEEIRYELFQCIQTAAPIGRIWQWTNCDGLPIHVLPGITYVVTEDGS